MRHRHITAGRETETERDRQTDLGELRRISLSVQWKTDVVNCRLKFVRRYLDRMRE